MEREQLVLLENTGVLPLSPKSGSVALLGPQADVVSMGDYVFFNASNNGVSPLAGVHQYLASVNSSVEVNYAEGCKLWSNDESGFADAVAAARKSDVAVVLVGTWTHDQTLLWTPGQNATTGEHNDLSDLGLVGAQRALVQAVVATGKPTVVVFVSGKPVTEPWIATRTFACLPVPFWACPYVHADAAAVVQQFYPGELGGQALAELLFGAFAPSGRLPVSFPRSVGTAPAFYNYLKGARPLDPGAVLDDGQLQFGHQYVLDSPVPIWSFGQGMSYVNFT
jgi:beta-glucosidase